MTDEAEVDEKRINSIGDFINKIEGTRTLSLFRGKPCDQPLVPKVARPWSNDADWMKVVRRREEWLIGEFRRRGFGLDGHPNLPTDTGDLLSVAQHFGLPTRLLDWTENALAALFFAVDDDEHSSPVVWQFEPIEDHFVPKDRKNTDGSAFDFLNPSFTMVFQPNHVTSRIRAQSGWFTLHQLKEEKVFPLERQTRYKRQLTKFTIQMPNKIRVDLDRIGINAASMYPDITGLTRHLGWQSKTKYKFKKK